MAAPTAQVAWSQDHLPFSRTVENPRDLRFSRWDHMPPAEVDNHPGRPEIDVMTTDKMYPMCSGVHYSVVAGSLATD